MLGLASHKVSLRRKRHGVDDSVVVSSSEAVHDYLSPLVFFAEFVADGAVTRSKITRIH
jgi:hypothetical protein